MKVKIKLDKKFQETLEAHGTTVYVPSKDGTTNEPKYHFLPYWFEHTDVDGEYIMHMLDHLPKELLDTLNFMRDKKKSLKQY